MWRERKEIEVGSVYVRPSRHRFYLPPDTFLYTNALSFLTRPPFSIQRKTETITCIRVHTFLCLFVAPPKTKHASLPDSRVLPHSAIIAFKTRAVAARHKEQNHRTEPIIHQNLAASFKVMPFCQCGSHQSPAYPRACNT